MENVGLIVVGIVFVVICIVYNRHQQAKRRAEEQARLEALQAKREALLAKYGDADMVDLIMDGKIRQGMTREQLVDSWGHPADIDEKVYKTKTKHTFKYNQSGRNRFRDRVFVENDIVVGWQESG